MGDKKVLLVVVIAGLLVVSGLGYIYTFSGFFGNEFYLGPSGKDGGIQFSPAGSCQKICEDGVFVGCENSLDDPVCGLSCKGAISEGPRRGEIPVVGSTLCEYSECVCN